ncbi:MAG: hypothetical protein AB8B85_21415, partial [Paracoccaceae bacterium]
SSLNRDFFIFRLQCLGPILLKSGGVLRSQVSEKGHGKTLTIDLGYPNRTTLPNQTEQDRKLSYTLLERWGILPENEQLVETEE